MLRKQLCVVERPEREGAHPRVAAARCAEAWLAYKRALLQLLADRRPRLEAGTVQRQLALPSRLPDWMQKEVSAAGLAIRVAAGGRAAHVEMTAAGLAGGEPERSAQERCDRRLGDADGQR